MSMAAMTNETPASHSAAPRGDIGIRLTLGALALIELASAMSGVPLVFGDDADIFGGAGGKVVAATLLLKPLAALAALGAVATGRLRPGVVAMACVVLLDWIGALPSFVTHKPDFGGFLTTAHMVFQIVACPLLAVMAMALARRAERLGAATVMVAAPMLVSLAGIVAFAVGVAIYGAGGGTA
jgi:hypothetical protein